MMTKKVVGVFVLAAALIGVVALSSAPAEAGNTRGGLGVIPTGTVTAVPTIKLPPNPCPPGWHVKAGTKSGDTFTCIPTKTTKMVSCPPGLEYYDNGCVVGCVVPAK